MPVSSLWRDTAWLHRLLPAITIRIKNAQITVILFTIVATKDVEFFLEQGGRMVLNLRRRDHMMVDRGLTAIGSLLLYIVQYTRNGSISLSVSIFITFTYEDPFQLFWLLLTSSKNRLIVRRIIWMSFIWLRLVFVLRIVGSVVNQITYLVQRCCHLVVLLLIGVYSGTVVPDRELRIVYMLAVILNFTPVFYLLYSLFLVTPILNTPWSILLFEFLLGVIIVAFQFVGGLILNSGSIVLEFCLYGALFGRGYHLLVYELLVYNLFVFLHFISFVLGHSRYCRTTLFYYNLLRRRLALLLDRLWWNMWKLGDRMLIILSPRTSCIQLLIEIALLTTFVITNNRSLLIIFIWIFLVHFSEILLNSINRMAQKWFINKKENSKIFSLF